MCAKYVRMLALLSLVISCLPLQSASADTGPKPNMQFNFTQEFPGKQVSIVSGILYECQQADCGDAKPLPKLGPQRFACQTTSCDARAYGFSDYHRLKIQFSDGKARSSNIFKTAEFNSIYNVTIRENDLLVKTQVTLGVLSPFTYALLCAGCALAIIAIVVILIIFLRRKNKMP